MRARQAVRHHALRHRDHACAARREGLHHRRPGDRRHGDARRCRPCRHDRQGQARFRRQALARAARSSWRRAASSSSASLTDDPQTVLDEGAQIVARSGPADADAHARPCDVELLEPDLRPLDRPGAGRRRPRAHRASACMSRRRDGFAAVQVMRAGVLRSRGRARPMLETMHAAPARFRQRGRRRAPAPATIRAAAAAARFALRLDDGRCRRARRRSPVSASISALNTLRGARRAPVAAARPGRMAADRPGGETRGHRGRRSPAALGERFHSLVDVGHRNVAIEVSGRRCAPTF